jgi:signal peptidase I
VFLSPADGTRLVKRVVALPGDRVEMTNNHLIINDQSAEYELSARDAQHIYAIERLDGHPHAVVITPALPARRSFGPIAVPADQYFVLGDNRDNSADSRYIGFVPRADILGRSSRVVYSLDAEYSYLPRWQRTLAPLP